MQVLGLRHAVFGDGGEALGACAISTSQKKGQSRHWLVKTFGVTAIT